MGWLKAALVAVVIFNYVVGTVLVWNAFRWYPDHSAISIFRWVAIYVVAVIQPIVWSFHHVRVLRAKGLQIDGQLRTVAFAPMVIGGLTLLIALNLITGR
jgi:hypothetical protein